MHTASEASNYQVEKKDDVLYETLFSFLRTFSSQSHLLQYTKQQRDILLSCK
jgi:hypothetical protein